MSRHPTLRETLRTVCTSWYGHDYRESTDHKRLYCRICGHVITLDGAR